MAQKNGACETGHTELLKNRKKIKGYDQCYPFKI